MTTPFVLLASDSYNGPQARAPRPLATEA